MLTVTKTVYYCEHCKRHRMKAAAIEKHEPRCIYNPDRSACGWHEPQAKIERPADHIDRLAEFRDLDWLHDLVDGCPACMLAVIVQAPLSPEDRYGLGFNYGKEVERFRLAERRDLEQPW